MRCYHRSETVEPISSTASKLFTQFLRSVETAEASFGRLIFFWLEIISLVLHVECGREVQRLT